MEQKLMKFYNDALEILESLDIEIGYISKVYVNYRAKSRWGRCRKTPYGYEIEISSMLLEDGVSYESTMDTVIHELLHAHKDRMSHTGEWKRCAELVNDCYSCFNIKRCTSAEDKNINIDKSMNFKYKITCIKCGHVNKYQRHSKAVQLIERNPLNSGCVCGRCKNKTFKFEYV